MYEFICAHGAGVFLTKVFTNVLSCIHKHFQKLLENLHWHHIFFFFSFFYIYSGNYILVWIRYIPHIFYMKCTPYKVISIQALTSLAVIISIWLSGFKCNHSEPWKNVVLILYLAEKNGCYFQVLTVNSVCWGFSLSFSKIIAFIPHNMNCIVHIVVICQWLEWKLTIYRHFQTVDSLGKKPRPWSV